MAEVCSFVVLSASGVAGDSGLAIDVCGYAVLSGATAAQPYFKNGTGVSSATVFRPGPITVSQGNVSSLPLPIRFPLGCYVSFDANTTSVTVFYLQALTA